MVARNNGIAKFDNARRAAERARRSRWLPHAIAVAATALMLALRLAIGDWIGDRSALILFAIPIVVVAYLGGLGPGLLATALAGAAADYVAMPPKFSFGFERPADFAHWSILLLFGILVSVLTEALHRSRLRAERAAAKLKRTESALLESKMLLRAISDHSSAVIYAKDLEGRYLFTNRRFGELVRSSSKSLANKTDYELFPAEVADSVRAMDRRAIAAGVPLTEEETVPHDDGPHDYISVKCPLFDEASQPYAVFGISTDITALKRTESALGVSEERAKAIVAMALDAVVAIDRNGLITEWNAYAETIFGRVRSEAVGHSLEIIIPERYREDHRRGLQRFLATGKAVVLNKRIELAGLHRDGHEFPIELSITPLGHGETGTFCAFVRDITERKHAEHALRESEERFRTMADTAPVLIWMSGTDKLCTWFNRSWLAFVGRRMEQELGNGWAENVHPDEFDRCLAVYTRSFDAREPFTMEYRLRRHDGQWRWLLDCGVPRYHTSNRVRGLHRFLHRHHGTQRRSGIAAREYGALSNALGNAAPPRLDLHSRRRVRLLEPPVGRIHGAICRAAARLWVGRGAAPRRPRARSSGVVGGDEPR
jgi:PAS domain S-box-containing protein